MKRQKFRRQKPLRGGRMQVSAGLMHEIEAAIQADMRRFGVSRSFVIAVALADTYSIEEQERYVNPKPRQFKMVAGGRR